MYSVDFKKLVDINNKVLTSNMFNVATNDSNYLQIIKGEGNSLFLGSVGDTHKVILNAESLDNVGLGDFTSINPLKLSKTLPFFEDEVSCFGNDGVLEFRDTQNTRNVKLHSLFMNEDFKISLDEINELNEDVNTNGVELNLFDFKNVLKKMVAVSSEEDEEDTKNIADINFRSDGVVFTGSAYSLFKTNFNLGLDDDLVLDKATASLVIDILNLKEEHDVLKIKADKENNKVIFYIGGDIVLVEEYLESVREVVSQLEEAEFEGNINLNSKEVYDALLFSITVSDEDSADMVYNADSNNLTIKTYVENMEDDSSKVDIDLEDDTDLEDFSLFFNQVKTTVLPILKQMDETVKLEVSFDDSMIKLEDSLNVAYVGITFD